MPLTSYCRKCACDVPVSDQCPHCGAKLPANTVRLAWCVDHTPVKDWMCWNAVMRLILPLAAVLTALMLALALLSGGPQELERMLAGGALLAVPGMLALGSAVILLVLILQGDDVLDCVADSRGLHVLRYLPHPTPVKLLLRLKSPGLMQTVSPESPMVLVSRQDIAWKDVARVQLWPEKTLILFYAPAWWLRLSLPCTPFTWEDALAMVRDKLGRKKTVSLPRELIAPPKPKAAKAAKEKQLTMDDLPELPPASEEQEGDFVPLEDVLRELQEAQKQEE